MAELVGPRNEEQSTSSAWNVPRRQQLQARALNIRARYSIRRIPACANPRDPHAFIGGVASNALAPGSSPSINP